jgi:two-component system, OmpR family, sensor kinase
VREAVRRLPIRLRLTLGFAAAMGLLLAALGLFVYLRFEDHLDELVHDRLESRAHDVGAVLSEGDPRAVPRRVLQGDDTFAQVLRPGGAVLASAPGLPRTALLSPDQLAQADVRQVTVRRTSVGGFAEPARLLARPATSGGSPIVLVVGASLGDRDEALASLRTLMLIGGAAALLAASIVGYALASSALRPVEAMRRRAAAISAGGPEERLPVPPAHDELRRLGETLNAMLDRLDQAIERERRFVDDASHELRTPLARQRAELELALRYEGEEPERLREAIADAIDDCDRLIAIAESLLVLARSQDGRMPLHREPLELAPLLAGVEARFAARAADAGRALRVEAPGGLRLRADRLRLEQALDNVVDNALRHGAGEVRLDARRRDGAVEIHVADQGPGFPPEFLPRAFERLSRADEARRGDGAGLGLAIVAAIARAHRGAAGAANAPGGGADVWIELPA